MGRVAESKTKWLISPRKTNMKINNLIPESVWYVLIGLNMGMFGTGAMMGDASLMTLSVVSSVACAVSLYTRDDDK